MTAVHSPFARTMSLTVHELRTPVTVVSGYLRMLLKEQGGPLNDKQRKMLEEAERSCSRISTLVTEMSELGKLEASELAMGRQDVDLSQVVTSVASNMHEGEDRGVTLAVQGADQPMMVVGDRTRLESALKGLMHAALRERGDPGVIVVRCVSNGSSAFVTVGDEDTQRALSDPPAETTPFDEWRGGLGLALPVARRIIAAHGGVLWGAPGERPRAGSALRLPLKP
jgi:signal transduction histidine kinase